MKKAKLIILIMLAAFTVKAQSIVLEFHANHNCAQVGLDSIWIQNLTQGGRMVLYYPDNIAVFVITDIGDFAPEHNHLYVSQNYPNPFSALTCIDVYLATPDVVSLNVYDLNGRTVVKHEDTLEEGMHRFSFSAGVEKTYILTVNSNKHVEKRIMLQMGVAGSAFSEISYLGVSADDVPKTAPKTSDFNFNPGDDLRFTGFVTDFAGDIEYGVINDAPEASTEYLFDIANHSPDQPSDIEGDDYVPVNETGLIYQVEETPGLNYLWSVPDGWEITQGQGSHAITVDAGIDGGDISVKAENDCGVSAASVLSVVVYVPTFELTLHSDPVGAGMVSGAGSYPAGEEVTVTAIANTGWVFNSWTDSYGNTISNQPEFTYNMPAEDMTLTASFSTESPMLLLTGEVSKTWKLYRVEPSMGVGPDLDNPLAWWFLENDGSRPCLYYHEFTFYSNGDYHFDDKGYMWGEAGIFHWDFENECIEAIPANMVGPYGEDLSPWLSGTHTFEYDPNAHMVTLNGLGTWIGMVQIGTDGEVTIPQNSVSFNISIEERDGYDYMHVYFLYEFYAWSFFYAHYHDPSLEPDVVEEQDPIDPLEELTPTEMFNTFASTSEEDVQILVPTESSVQLTVGVDDPADPNAAKVGEYFRIATDWQELQFATQYYIQFDNFTTVSLDVYLPSSNDYSGPLSKDIAIIIANNHDTPEWWNHHLQYDVDAEEVVLDEWQTWTFQLDEPTSGPGIPNGNPFERDDLNFFAISIGGAGHSIEGTFYIRNFIFDGSDDNGNDNIIYGDGVTDIDGNEYMTVIIGDQEWMAENLRVTRDANGNNITRYCYGNNTTNCELYGGLYTWHTVMNGQSSSSNNPSGVQGICPEGWYIPNHDQWTQLEQYLCNALGNSNCETQFPYDNTTTGMRGTNEGNALKSCRQVHSPLGGDCNTSEHPRWNSHGTHHGFDYFGFSALPGGSRNANGSFYSLGTYGFWWSSTESSSTYAWLRSMGLNNGGVYRYGNPKTVGFSLRCVRDLVRTKDD